MTISLPVAGSHSTADEATRRVIHVESSEDPTNLTAPPQPTATLIDRHGRTIAHLRLSVTSACNLRCLYCRPQRDRAGCSGGLNDRQRLQLVLHLHRRFGLTQLRLTGGEPLLHPTLLRFIAAICDEVPDLSVAMTTNACRLALLAPSLRDAGLRRLNISLDTIDPSVYRRLTGGSLAQTLRGIERAIAVGFPPPRINTVVLKGINDHQLADLVEWAFRSGCEIRFLEAMPIGSAADFNRAHFVSASEIRRRLARDFTLRPLPRVSGETAARYDAISANWHGTLGVIAPISESFCGQCRRIRVTADGKLYPCLLDNRFVELSDAWADGAWSAARLDSLVLQAVRGKAPSGALHQSAAMIKLGG